MPEWNELDRLLQDAESLSYGPTRTAILEEAVRLADAIGDEQAQYDARMELVAAASFGGAAERALVAFTWCLKTFDKSPDTYDEYDLLWAFKWILGSLPDFCSVPLQRIRSVQDDFEKRLKEFNHGLAPLYKLKCRNAMDLGDPQAALKWYTAWQSAPYDLLQDCPACQTSSEGNVLIFLGRTAEGLEVLRPILTGRLSCHSVPATTYGFVLEPLISLGRDREALEYHRVGYRAVSRNPDFLSSVADHLVFAVRQQNTDQASRIFQRHLPAAWESREDEIRREFLVASWIFLEHLATVSHRRRKLALPATLDCHRKDSLYQPAALADWFRRQADQIVKQFDQRNGNTFYQDKLQRLAAFARVVEPTD